MKPIPEADRKEVKEKALTYRIPGIRLTPFECNFISRYLVNPNASSVIEEMTSLRNGKAIAKANEMLKKPLVRYHLELQLEAQQSRNLLTADRVLQEIMRLAMYDLSKAFDENGDCLPVSELPKDLAAALEGFDTEEVYRHGKKSEARITKYRFAKKQGPLQMLAEHLRLIVQKFEVTGSNGAPLVAAKVDLTDVTTALLEKIVAKAEAPSAPEEAVK